MTPQQMKQRIDDLEDALFSVYAHNVNIAHHKSCIDNILRKLFSEEEFLTRSQGGGRHPMYAEDMYKTLKDRFEPKAKG
jgi:hypothetical protein